MKLVIGPALTEQSIARLSTGGDEIVSPDGGRLVDSVAYLAAQAFIAVGIARCIRVGRCGYVLHGSEEEAQLELSFNPEGRYPVYRSPRPDQVGVDWRLMRRADQNGQASSALQEIVVCPDLELWVENEQRRNAAVAMRMAIINHGADSP